MNFLERTNFDRSWIGFICGLFSPVLTLFIFYLIRYSNHLSFGEFYSEILLANNIITPSISLCVITNLLVFFIFIWTNRNLSARGVLFSTFIYAGYVMYQKYIG